MIYFSIHGIVGIQVEDEYPWLQTLVNDLPEIFMCSSEEYTKCEKTISIRYDKKLDVKGNRDLFVQENSFQDNEYGVKISLENNQLSLECCQECNEWMMFALSYQLNKAGYCFVHAAAFENKGEVVLIPSSGGTGKTIITIEWVRKRGFRLLGDDLCIIDRNGNVYSYPKKMVIYPWHRDQIDGSDHTHTRKSLSISNGIKEKIKKIVRKSPFLLAFIRKHNPSLKQYSPNEVFKKDVISERGVLKQIIFLERQEQSHDQTEDQIAVKMYLTTFNELFHYFCNKIEFLCREKSVIDPLCLHVTPFLIMQSNTRKCETHILNIPPQYNKHDLLEIVNKEQLRW